MSMTKQDFEALAHMCADETHKELLCDATIDLLVAFCKSRNPNFDSYKFHNCLLFFEYFLFFLLNYFVS